MQHHNFRVEHSHALCESVGGLLESAGFATRVFASATDYLLDAHPKDGCLVAEIRVAPMHSMARAGAALDPLGTKSDSADARAARERLKLLTPRELAVLIEVARGNPNKVAAYNLGISPRTVEVHRARIMVKLEAASLSDLVRLVLVTGLDGGLG